METSTKRPWLLITLRGLFVTVTVLLALAIGFFEYEFAQPPPGWSGSDAVFRDATPTFQQWANGLVHVGLLTLLAIAMCATVAVFQTQSGNRKRTIWVALGLFLLFVATLIGNNVLGALARAERAESDALAPQASDRAD